MAEEEIRPATLGIGIVGCGRAGFELHLPALARVGGARIAALADNDPARLEAARARVGAERCHGDYRALLESDDVDIVLVAVPPDGHAEVVRACLQHGKHVLAEKPLAASPGEARELVELARRAGVVTAVGHNLRCHRLLREARSLLASGAIGRVEAVRCVWSSDIAGRSQLPSWRWRRDRQGGVIHEMGVHLFDALRFLLGVELEQVAALSRPGERDDDSTAISCRLDGGIPATLLLSQRSAVELRLEVLGSEGRLSVDAYRFDGLEVVGPGVVEGSLRSRLGSAGRALRQLPRGLRVARLGGDFLDSYRVEWECMLAAVNSRAPVACSFADGYRAVVAAHAAARSVTTGTIVSALEDHAAVAS